MKSAYPLEFIWLVSDPDDLEAGIVCRDPYMAR